jgi:hypothetical protein
MENNISEMLFAELADLNNISAAINLAFVTKTKSRLFCDPEEFSATIDTAALALQVQAYLLSPHSTFLTGRRFGIPYSRFCDRQGIYLNLFGTTVYYCFGQLFYRYLDGAFPKTVITWKHNFFQHPSNATTPDEIFERFDVWREEHYPKGNNCLLHLDIANFFDTIDHQVLVDRIAKRLGVPVNSRLMSIFKRILAIRTDDFRGEIILQRGLPLGNGIDEYFSNLYLLDFDNEMAMNAGFSYARLINDELFFAVASFTEAKKLVGKVTESLKRIGLNINRSKTTIFSQEDQVVYKEYMEAVNPYDIFSAYHFVKVPASASKTGTMEERTSPNDKPKLENEQDATRFIKRLGELDLGSGLDEATNNLYLEQVGIIFFKYPKGQYFNFQLSEMLVRLTFGALNKMYAPQRSWGIIAFNVEKQLSTVTCGLSVIIQLLDSERVPYYSKYSILRAIFDSGDSKSLEDSYYLAFSSPVHFKDSDMHDNRLINSVAHYRELLLGKIKNWAEAGEVDLPLESYSRFVMQRIAMEQSIQEESDDEF